jgi:hypothetical protein
MENKSVAAQPSPHAASDEIKMFHGFSLKYEKAKRLLFLFTFIVVMHFGFLNMSNNSIYFFALFPMNFFFPTGLIEIPSLLFRQPVQNHFYLIDSPIGQVIAFFGWSIYFCIAFVGTKTKSRILFVALYILFFLLLLGNISGCISQLEFFPRNPYL